MQDLTANGAHAGPPDSLARVRDHVREAQAKTAELVADMRVLLLDEQRVYDELQAALKESRGRRDHLNRALEHLTGDTKRYGTKTAKAKAPWGSAKPPVTMPSEKALREVLEWMRGKPAMTIAQLSDGAPVSSDTVRRCLYVLRDREQARLAGKSKRGGAMFALMPEVEAGSYAHGTAVDSAA